MATGTTYTSSLADSLPDIVNQARIIRETKGVISQLADRVKLGTGAGNSWKEISLAQLTASAITETSEEDNPQVLADTPFSITPEMISVHTFLTDRAARNVSKNVIAKTGALAQNAIERKKDIDGITVLDGATTSLCGTGTTLTSGHVAAGVFRIRSNATETWDGPVSFVLHGFQAKDLYDELISGVGTYPIPAGSTAEVYGRGYMLPIADAAFFQDDNIPIDSTPDAKGGVFASGPGGAIVLCQARAPFVKMVRDEFIGGGGTNMLHRDEYAYAERSSGNWLFEIQSDATTPTS